MEREEFLNSALSDQLNAGFVNLNWDQSMEQSSQFESALSSIVSSPSNPTPPADNVVIRELIGRLGSICNSGEMSPQSKNRYLGGGDNSTNTSCYSTPLNSPPKLGLSVPEQHHRVWGNPPVSGNPVPIPGTHLGGFATDPGFAERAAKFSCFGGGRSYGGLPRQFGMPEVGKLSRVSSSKSLKSSGGGGGSQPDDGELGSAREESSVSDHVTIIGGGNARKRKVASRSKAKETPKVTVDESNGRKSRSSETKVEQNGGVESGDGQGKESDSKPSEPPKQDYIHVRARRGQATDSHSLAERVRREKISERMKFLQDLVPGCNKVTGKAVMLDEIINYVQSLQRQVEFLSMKLATVNPRLDLENLIQKDLHGSSPHSVFPGDTCASAFPFVQQHTHPSGMTNGLQSHCAINPLDVTLRRPLNVQLPAADGFGDAVSLIGTLWEDDLQSVVQMGFGQNQEGLPFTGALPTGHMKVEL